jgi:hypothetical protein
MVMLGIIEAYVGFLPDDVAELHEILYDVMILTERPEFDEIDDDDEYVSDDDVNEEVSSDAAAHFGPFE